MTTLSASPVRIAALALVVGAVTVSPTAAQPAAGSGLPGGYGHLGPPPPGYPGTGAAPSYNAPRSAPAAAPRTMQPQAAPRPASTPKSYGPLPDNLSIQVAQLAANDQQQESRIRKLERDVSSIKGGAPIRLGSSNVDSAAGLRPHTSYVVRPGDSLWRVASAHRVAPGEIMQLNRMKSDSVMVGQTLMIPAPHGSSGLTTTQVAYKPVYHTVRSGDTSSVIAKKYGVSRQSLMEANPHVDFGGGLIPGSRLIIPGKTVSVSVPKTSSSTSSSSSGSYVVKPGDSLKAIAIKHGTTTANLASLNGIKDANKLVVGQRLVLPGGKATTSRSTASTSSSKSKSTPKSTPPPTSSDTVPIPGMGLPPPPPGYGAASAGATPPPPAAASTSKPASKPVSSDSTHRGVLAYRVDGTDSIDTIASQFGTTPARIREINHLQPTTQLKSGDEIMVPAMAGVGN